MKYPYASSSLKLLCILLSIWTPGWPFCNSCGVASVVGNTVSTSSLPHVIREMKYIFKKQIELLKINTKMSEINK